MTNCFVTDPLYPLSRLLRRNFDWCRHFDISSLFSFSVVVLSPSRIHIFSAMQRLHDLPPHLQGVDFLAISHCILYSFSWSFSDQIYADKAVSCSYFGLRNDFVWFLHLSLNWPSTDPQQHFSVFFEETVALYTMHDVKHSPFKGHFFGFLQSCDYLLFSLCYPCNYSLP